MKKIVLLVFCITMVFSLTACGYDEDDLREAYRQGYDECLDDMEAMFWDGEYDVEEEPSEEGVYYVSPHESYFDVDFDNFNPPAPDYWE